MKENWRSEVGLGKPEVFRVLYSIPLLGMVLFAFSVGFPPSDDATAVNLPVHMLQHVLIVVSGVLVAYPLCRRGFFVRVQGRRSASVGLLVVFALVAFWHFPEPWDTSVLNPLVHAFEHVSFLVVGLLIGSLLQKLSSVTKVEVLVLGFFVQFFYAIILLSPRVNLYPLYSLNNQHTLGIIMFSAGHGYWLGVILFIVTNPSIFGKDFPFARRRPFTPSPSFLKLSRRIPPILTTLLLVSLLGFYGASAVAIAFTPSQRAPHDVAVYIVETPVTWNYSPERIRVVLGANNTVEWISHSFSYDTVTGVNFDLSSGNIAPGQTFFHTFSEPGTYEYRCIYHPWMVGHVTVVASEDNG